MRLLPLCFLLATACDDEPGETGPAETGETATPSVCDTLGLSERAFVSAAPTATLLATASDVTVPTTDGDWNLAEHWPTRDE